MMRCLDSIAALLDSNRISLPGARVEVETPRMLILTSLPKV
jgi:hypothetical protein